MPNICFTTMEITGSENQIKKIYNRLIINEDFSNINLDVDYKVLYALDKINIALNDDTFYEMANSKFIEGVKINVNGVTELVTNIEQFMHFAYKNTKSIYHTPYDISSMSEVELLDKFILKMIECKKSNHKKDEYCFSNILPDNPLCHYRNISSFKIRPDTNIHLDNWYSSRIQRLSTKWFPDISTCEITSPDTLYISMDCAWGPCIELAKYLTYIYDIKIDIQYSEGGMGFVGGEIVEDNCSTEYFSGESQTGLHFCKLEDGLFGMDSFDENFIDYITCDMDTEWDKISIPELRKHLIDEEDWMDEQQIEDTIKKYKPMRKIKIKRV